MKSYVLQCKRLPLAANHVPLVAHVILLERVICFLCLSENRHQPIPAVHIPCTAWNITCISMICHFRFCPRLFLHNICRTSDGSAGVWPRTWAGICKCWERNYWWSWLLRHSRCYVLIRLFFSGLFYSQDLHKNEETMVFEAHCMSFPCTELLLFNYAKVNTVFHSMALLRLSIR